MAKKKNKQKKKAADGGNGQVAGPQLSQSAEVSPTSKKDAIANSSSSSKSRNSAAPATQPPTSPALIICRNKHWRYISSFHGPWLQLPHDLLEMLANINYTTPRPRPVDTAVFYDLLKIRRLVDDATDLAVRAASGLVSLNSLNNSHPGAALGLGFGTDRNQPKLSAERKHKLREQSTQKLAKAYRLDEIACSVATMQSASALEDVASLVLKRDPDNLDARYVHFFHEKIPSRQLAESTSLAPLDEVIERQQSAGEPLRTRATVRVFKEDYEGAARDLTEAIRASRLHEAHNKAEKSREFQIVERSSRRLDVKLDEDQQPSSLYTQLLFARAGVYLSIACLHVNDALRPVALTIDAPSELNPTEKENQRRVLEARKVVKSNAKKALKDYMNYLSHLDYSPNLPTDIAEDFTRKVKAGKNRSRRPVSGIRSESPSSDWSHTVYTLDQLFTATPPSDIPPYPSTDVTLAGSGPDAPATYTGSTMEMVTYHPLLTDALHSLLLCHTLTQTSTKELQRHAYMVARIARLADGYPIFQASRSPARADWIEVLRRGENWIHLSSPWESLCAAAPLYPSSSSQSYSQSTNGGTRKALPTSELSSTVKDKDPQVKDAIDAGERERINHQALMRAIEDDRVGDEATLRRAYSAHKKRAEDDLRAAKGGEGEINGDTSNKGINLPVADEACLPSANGSKSNGTASTSAPAPQDTSNNKERTSSPNSRATSPGTAHRRWAMDEGREYPILTERASAVARWLREAPAGAGGTGSSKKKKKTTAHAHSNSPLIDAAASAAVNQPDNGGRSFCGHDTTPA